MRKLLALMTAVMVTLQLTAAPVDPATAKTKAQQYLTQKVFAGKYMAPGASEATLIKTELSDKTETPVYYIFNTATTFVIVSGDDRAEEILAYGDRPLNLDRMPTNMKVWLDSYKRQLEWLLNNPDAKVEKTTYRSPAIKETVYGPLLTCLWDQTEPYWNLCKFTYNGTQYQCYTGCPATSASMVMYYWKFPKTQVGPLPAYSASLELSYYNSVNFTYAALPAVTFDWDNMLDHYGTWVDENGTSHTATYNTAQGQAVATLMRYVGQAEHMMYGTAQAGGSGIYTTDAQNVADMYIGFGYDASTTRLVQKGNYSEANWASLLQTEMIEGRPVVFMAVDNSAGGHAFNVDGYNASTNKYHINFGWSGEGNNWCAMNAFADGEGYNFNSDQQMIIGIQPPYDGIVADPEELAFDGFVGETYTKTFTVTGYNVDNPITITKSGGNAFTVSHTSITAAQAANGVDVTVTYKPTAAGTSSATLTLSSEGVDDVTVAVSGNARPRVPTLIANPETLSFTANINKTMAKTVDLTGMFLTNNVTATLNDPSGVFTVSPASIATTSFNGETPVKVTISFSSEVEGQYTGSVTFKSEGAQDVTVQLNAKAVDGGTASDPYLNIAKYQTIDEAGFTGITKLYNYTEYPDQECAWLTVSNYGVMLNGNTQKWFKHDGTQKSAQENWAATDIFLGNTAYGSNYYANWNENYQTFYVTNCTQVKQYSYNIASSYGASYPLKMEIYECTLNANGTLTDGASTVDYKQSTTTNTPEVVTSSALDPEKIYKVKIFNDYSHLYEIGFQTPLDTYEVPVATAATDITATSFVANWLPCNGATSYTLRMKPFVAAPLMNEAFAGCTTNGSQNIGSSMDNYCDNTGWTGTSVYTAVGGVRLGTGSATGSIVTPALNLSTTLGKVYVKVKAKTYTNNSGTSDTDCGLTISCGDASETLTVTSATEEEFLVALDCTQAANQNVTLATTANRKRVIITGVEIYDGEPATGEAAEPILFTGITANSYNVTGLQPATTYIYDVMAIYGTDQSRWSNAISVLTAESTVLVGDVNADGEVTSYDITLLYNWLLENDDTDIVYGDQDGDGEITANDIATVYSVLLDSKKK